MQILVKNKLKEEREKEMQVKNAKANKCRKEIFFQMKSYNLKVSHHFKNIEEEERNLREQLALFF